jgi:NAD(P)-dependent dehydrogenase (short-subunit alcohol dehydrogenase family)
VPLGRIKLKENEKSKIVTEDRGKKRVALVTGSTSGIGMAIAKRLAEDGFTVAFHSKSSMSVGQSLAKAYPSASYFQADLSDQSQSRNLIAQVLSHYGRLDVLVNNAGISATISHTSLKEASPEIWRNLYEVNVIAPWTLIAESENALRQSSSHECPKLLVVQTTLARLL